MVELVRVALTPAELSREFNLAGIAAKQRAQEASPTQIKMLTCFAVSGSAYTHGRIRFVGNGFNFRQKSRLWSVPGGRRLSKLKKAAWELSIARISPELLRLQKSATERAWQLSDRSGLNSISVKASNSRTSAAKAVSAARDLIYSQS